MEIINARKTSYCVKAEDIKHSSRITDDQIADIPHERVFEWIKSGAWKKKDFEKWLRVIRVIE